MLALLCCVAFATVAQAAQVPVYMWTQKVKGAKEEFSPEIGADGQVREILATQVSEEVENILSSTKLNSFIVYNRPGMSTQGLISTLKNNDRISSILKVAKPKAIERSFVDVTGEVGAELTKKFETTKKILIDSKDSLEELKKEFEQAPKPFIHQYYIIDVAVADDAAFDEIVFQVEQAFKERTLGNHLSILAGSPLEHRSLQEVTITPSAAHRFALGDDEDEPFQYVTSNILTKALVVIPIVFLLIIAFGLMFDIKTPTLFVSQSIDFGKIEK